MTHLNAVHRTPFREQPDHPDTFLETLRQSVDVALLRSELPSEPCAITSYSGKDEPVTLMGYQLTQDKVWYVNLELARDQGQMPWFTFRNPTLRCTPAVASVLRSLDLVYTNVRLNKGSRAHLIESYRGDDDCRLLLPVDPMVAVVDGKRFPLIPGFAYVHGRGRRVSYETEGLYVTAVVRDVERRTDHHHKREWTVRHAEYSDEQAIKDVHAAAIGAVDHPDMTPEQKAAWVAVQHGRWDRALKHGKLYVAETDGEVIGTCGWNRDSEGDRDVAWARDFYVKPGRGFGRDVSWNLWMRTVRSCIDHARHVIRIDSIGTGRKIFRPGVWKTVRSFDWECEPGVTLPTTTLECRAEEMYRS